MYEYRCRHPDVRGGKDKFSYQNILSIDDFVFVPFLISSYTCAVNFILF